MSNHTIKAKRKITGTVYDITCIDSPYGGYIYIIDYLNTQYTEQQFNDLFEVVGDKNCSSSVVVEDKNTLINKDIDSEIVAGAGYQEDKIIPQTDTLKKEDRFTDEAIDKRTKDFCKLTGLEEPKIKYDTDTLNKEDWEDKKIEHYLSYFFDEFYNNIPNCIEKSALGGEKLFIAFKPVAYEMYKTFVKQQPSKHFITQEIAKVKEEIVEKIKNYMPELIAIDKDVIIEIIQNNK
jgi:hypothetical protein